MKKNYTHIIINLDKSGSMSDCWTKTIKGLENFIKDNSIDGMKTTYSLYTFDSSVDAVSLFKDISDNKIEKIHPDGYTALFDAFGTSCVKEGEALAKMPESERPEKVIVFTLTDGGENASREYTGEAVKNIIKEQEEKYGWKFIFFGADFNLNAVSSSIGLAKSHSRNVSKATLGAQFTSGTLAIKSYRQSGYNDSQLESALESIGD